jgi:hypothetical protein
MAQVVEHLPSMHEALGCVKITNTISLLLDQEGSQGHCSVL